MKLLFYWNLCTREAKNVEKNVSGFLFLWRFVVIHRFISDQQFLQEEMKGQFYSKYVLKKQMKEVLATTCRQFMFIISIENERVGESCVITTKE